MLKDKIFSSFEEEFNKKCFSCDSKKHDLLHCSLIRNVPNKEKILNHHLTKNKQERKAFPRWKMKYNSLIFKKRLKKIFLSLNFEKKLPHFSNKLFN